MVEVREVPNAGRYKMMTLDQDTYWVAIVDGREYRHVSETPEMALLVGLGIKFDDAHFSKHAGRMLGIDSVWTK